MSGVLKFDTMGGMQFRLRTYRAVMCALAALLLQESGFAASEDEILFLNAEKVNVKSQRARELRDRTRAPAHSKALYLVHFRRAISPAVYKMVCDTKVFVVSPIPSNAYLVWADKSSFQRLRSLPENSLNEVDWYGAFLPEWKIQGKLSQIRPSTAQPFQIQLVLDDAVNKQTVGFVLAKNGTIKMNDVFQNYRNLRVLLSPADVAELAQQPDVVSISEDAPPRLRDFEMPK